MYKKVIVLLMTCSVLLTGCAHEHKYSEATCSKPATCEICGETTGAPTAHIFVDATCKEPLKCSVCGATDGEPLGHDYSKATCTNPATCTRCGDTIGYPLEHTIENEEIIEEPTCSSPGKSVGTCSVCGEKITTVLKYLEHTEGDFEIEVPATYYSSGKKTSYCAYCGKKMGTVSYELSEEEKEKDFKADCPKYTYDEIARDPDSVMGDNAMFTGQVVQVMEDDRDVQLRVDITKTSYGYTDTIYVTYTRGIGESRILEGDIVTMWGCLDGTITYTAVLGNQVTIPYMQALYLEVK